LAFIDATTLADVAAVHSVPSLTFTHLIPNPRPASLQAAIEFALFGRPPPPFAS
jgi:hypothetical protein